MYTLQFCSPMQFRTVHFGMNGTVYQAYPPQRSWGRMRSGVSIIAASANPNAYILPVIMHCAGLTRNGLGSYPNVGMSIKLCVGSLVAKALTSQGLKLGFQLYIMVHLLHAPCKECSRIIILHIDETGQPASLYMVHRHHKGRYVGDCQVASSSKDTHGHGRRPDAF